MRNCGIGFGKFSVFIDFFRRAINVGVCPMGRNFKKIWNKNFVKFYDSNF